MACQSKAAKTANRVADAGGLAPEGGFTETCAPNAHFWPTETHVRKGLSTLERFTPYDASRPFFGDLHIQGIEGVQSCTQHKMTMTRWFPTATEAYADPIGKTQPGGA